MPIANVGRIKINYDREGAGFPILSISGLGGGEKNWVPVVAQLKHEFECITFDNRELDRASSLGRDTASIFYSPGY